MKQQEVFKKISGIIKEINEQYEYLETANGVYNDLELELLAANAHFLSDHIEILKKLNVHAAPAPAPVDIKPEVTEDKPVTEPRYFEPVMDSPEEPALVDPEVKEEPAHTIEFEIGSNAEPEAQPAPEAIEEPVAEEPEPEKPEQETIRHELTLEDIGEDWDEEDDEAEDIELEPEPVKSEEAKPEPVAEEPKLEIPDPEPEKTPEPVAAKPEPEVEPAPVVIAVKHTQILVEEEQVITLNQRMSAQMATSRVTDQLVGQPIADLKNAITLNDKMLYVKDLFNGYSLAYSEALDILNRLKTFEEAQSFLKGSYATKNNWADKTATADKFYALLQRRYL